MGQTSLVASPPDIALVRVTNFHKCYGKNEAVDGVDFHVLPGEIYGLIGPDGAGKSSLMKAIAGVLSFDAGAIEVLGVHVDSERAAERIKDRVGFMPQGLGLNLYPELSVEENVNYFARLRLVPEDDLRRRKQQLLGMTRLDRFRSRPMKNLSGGMKQKLALVCTFIHEPELIVLDEPTTGVDPVSRRDFWAVLAELMYQRDITALVSTAYLEEASRFHRMTLIHEGHVLAEGEPDTILNRVPGSKVAVAAQPQVQALVALRAAFPHVEAFGSQIEVFVENATAEAAMDEVQNALAGLEISRINAVDGDLEDVFLAMVRGQQASRERSASAIELVRGVECANAIPSGENAIEARLLVRDFASFRAVDGVSLRVESGQIFGLLGANGAGKTTVIKMLTGILRATSGQVLIAGANMRRARRRIKRSIGYMSQAFSLYQDLTVLENMRLYAGIYGMSRGRTHECADYLLSATDLAPHVGQRAGGLPVGLRQRLALACALMHDPQILFLDEPTSGVDPGGRRFFWELLFALSRERNVTILVTTHYMSEAEHCDRLALMYEGRVVADDSPSNLKRELEHAAGFLLSVWTDSPLDSLACLQHAGYDDAAVFGKHVHVLTADPELARTRIHRELENSGIDVHGVEQIPVTMENVFVHRVRQLNSLS